MIVSDGVGPSPKGRGAEPARPPSKSATEICGFACMNKLGNAVYCHCRLATYDNDSSDINDAASLSGVVAAPAAATVQPPSTVSAESFQTVPLCADDAAAIYDLHLAYRNSLEVNDERDLSRHHANLSDLVNIAELSVRRVIAMAKQVPAFRALPQVRLRHARR